MKLTHQLTTVQYTQGWLESQLDFLVEAASGPTKRVTLNDKSVVEMREMFLVLDKTVDELLNQIADLEIKVAAAKQALG
jgi:hypothetical protein